MVRLQELRKTATHDAGVWRLKQGAEFYAARLRDMTTTTLGADEIHAYGLAEVARIEAEMDAIMKAQGMSEGTVGSRMAKLRVDPRFALQNNPADRERVLTTYRNDTARAMALAPQYFSRLPKAPVEVQAVPDFAQERSAGAYYEQPALDGTRPGRVFVNLRDVGEWPLYAIHTTAFHEGVPGHHFQIALAQELEGLPMLRKLLTPPAFAEGWALYSERLAREMGLLQDDPYGDLGRLNAEMFRAVRLVVDTGMHAKRWSREQAIAYMRDITGNTETDVGGRDRALCGLAGAGMRLQTRHALDHGHARQGAGRTRGPVRHQGIPRRCSGKRRTAAESFEANMGRWIAAQKGAPRNRRAINHNLIGRGLVRAGGRHSLKP